ncbi:MAG TPA: hypothetical protein VF937_18225 [Chloroflexota bacterium]
MRARGAPESVVRRWGFAYISRAMQEFHAGEWCFDPYAKQCEWCDTIVGRYAVMTDQDGVRHVLFWPQPEWDGVPGSNRCRLHTRILERWVRLA